MDRPYRAYRFVHSRRDAILAAIVRYAAAAALLVPGSFLLSVDAVYMSLGIATLGWGPYAAPESTPETLLRLLFLFSWPVLLLWAGATDSIKRSVSRAGWALCVGGFLLPSAGITEIMGPPPSSGAWFGQGFILTVSIIIGGVIGLTGFGLAKASAPEDTPEDSIWFMFRPLGGGKAALATGLLWLVAVLLYLAAYVMNMYGWEGLV